MANTPSCVSTVECEDHLVALHPHKEDASPGSHCEEP